MLPTILTAIDMVLGALLIAAILLQQKGAGLGATFGGGGGIASTRRGVDLFLFRATIVLAILFFGVTLASLLL